MTDVTAVHRILHRHRILQVVGRSSAHDLRNASQTMQMSADLLRGVPDADVSIPELLDATSYRTLDLANRLARWSAATPRMAEAAALAQVIAPLEDLLYNHPARDRFTLELRIPVDCPLVVVVPEKMLEALWALVTNAMRAAEPGRDITVTISAARRDHGVEVLVEDDGPGVSADALPTLFTVQESSAGEPPRLGLAVARALLRDDGGELAYQATSRGARFVCSLPVWPLSSRA